MDGAVERFCPVLGRTVAAGTGNGVVQFFYQVAEPGSFIVVVEYSQEGGVCAKELANPSR